MLRVENLTKVFNLHILNEKIIESFENVSFSVKEGSSLGISGPSGSGKTSLLKCIYRTYKETRGKIYYESFQFGKVDLTTATDAMILKIRENEIGYVAQFLIVIPRISCIDIVSEPLIAKGVTEKEAKEKAKELLLYLGIPEKLFEAYPATFSGGEKQRVNIAKAVIYAPRLLLLDEPTASLDLKATSKVLDLLKDLRKKGTTMIGIFHDPDILKEFSDEIYEMPLKGDKE